MKNIRSKCNQNVNQNFILEQQRPNPHLRFINVLWNSNFNVSKHVTKMRIIFAKPNIPFRNTIASQCFLEKYWQSYKNFKRSSAFHRSLFNQISCFLATNWTIHEYFSIMIKQKQFSGKILLTGNISPKWLLIVQFTC